VKPIYQVVLLDDSGNEVEICAIFESLSEALHDQGQARIDASRHAGKLSVQTRETYGVFRVSRKRVAITSTRTHGAVIHDIESAMQSADTANESFQKARETGK